MDLFSALTSSAWSTKYLWLPLIGLAHLSIIFHRNNRSKLTLLTYTLALSWFFVIAPIAKLSYNLGVDSFSEARNFSLSEAFFWLSTIIQDTSFENWKSTTKWILITLIYLYFWKHLISKYNSTTKSKILVLSEYSTIIIFIVIVPIIATGSSYLAFMKSSNLYMKVENNFSDPSADMKIKENPSNKASVLLYIGESTSSMHMALYGYPRKTTPLLSHFKKNNPSTILGKNIWSTHTHTSPSLLESLSIAENSSLSEEPTTIFNQKRISLPNIANHENIPTILCSNQGKTGTWNIASTIIFKNGKSIFSTNNSTLGNLDTIVEKPYDHLFFNNCIKNQFKNDETPTKSLYTFHSYAGHGPYIENIPHNFRNKIDKYYSGTSSESIIGSSITANNIIENIESYDSAISYIDYSITNALNFVKQLSEPMIFVYTSDHGESPLSGRSHDSSRFIMEMASVPLIIYFNDAAIRNNPYLYQETKKLIEENSFATLSQLPDTILSLLGITITNYSNGSPYSPCPIGSPNCQNKYLITRDLGNKISYVRSTTKSVSGDNYIDSTDDATEHNILYRMLHNNDMGLCYHRSNSIAKAIRGLSATNCIEFDITINNGHISVNHPPSADSGLSLSQLLITTEGFKNKKLWIDAKNIDNNENCIALKNSINIKDHFTSNDILIEFPPSTQYSKDNLSSCINELQINNFITSFYIPTNIGLNCISNLEHGIPFTESNDCLDLQQSIAWAHSKNWFSDISFDYRLVSAIQDINQAYNFKWNTWNIKSSDIMNISKDRFRFIIPTNNDPNNR